MTYRSEVDAGPSELAPGVFRFRIPIPLPLRHANVYLLAGKSDFILVDAGINTGEAFQALSSAVHGLGWDWQRLRLVILTHGHIDHIGLAGELRKAAGARVHIHPLEREWLKAFQEFTPEQVTDFFRSHGMTEMEMETADQFSRRVQRVVESVQVDMLDALPDGAEIHVGERRWQTVWTPGHTPGHLCLFSREDGLFLSGDHLLPRISPHISFSPGSRPSPLHDYLASLAHTHSLPVSTTFPAHGQPMPYHRRRIRYLQKHHRSRLTLMLAALAAGPRTARDVAVRVWKRKLSSEDMRFAMLESLAHLRYLEVEGKIEMFRRNGLVYFRERETSREQEKGSRG